jgi:hypothetical protein
MRIVDKWEHKPPIRLKNPKLIDAWTAEGDSLFVDWPLPNVALGVSVEDQPTADKRILDLVETPAALRFVSYEPALGPVDFFEARAMGLRPDGPSWTDQGAPPAVDQIIFGGETGPRARPSDIRWAYTTVEDCASVGVLPFVKQLGSRPKGLCAARETDGSIYVPDDAEFCDVYESGEGGHCGSRCHLLKSRKCDNPQEWPEDLRVRKDLPWAR